MIKKMMDLSTGHVPGPKADFGDVRHVAHDHGWVVFVNPHDLKHWPRRHPCPDWLRPMLESAVEKGCILINFDSDASYDEAFAAYEW